MKVGTDGVLLGSWATCLNPTRILDIGTGSGLIALMMAQRHPTSEIIAIDIDQTAIYQAGKNFQQSTFCNQIELIESSLQQFITQEKFDLIVCNPPYFSNSTKTPNISRSTARHDDKLPPSDLFSCASKLLTEQGALCIIVPITNLQQVVETAEQQALFPAERVDVFPTATSKPKRVLLKFNFDKLPPNTSSLIIEDSGRHGYSEDFKKLTGNFYLNI